MPQLNKQEQLRALLRPLSDQFTSQVAATITSFVQQSVRDEVEVVLGRALSGVAQPAQAAAPSVPAHRMAAGANTKKRTRPAAKKKAKAPKIECSKQRCHERWYRPSGAKKKLCYKHFLEAGGKPPPGVKGPKKK